jgi:hypothetical protein
MPPKGRPANQLLGELSAGAWVVVSQSAFNSAKLKDSATGQWVDGSVDIPLERILAGPRRCFLNPQLAKGV